VPNQGVYGQSFFAVNKQGPPDAAGVVDVGDVEAGIVHADGSVPPVYDFQSAIRSTSTGGRRDSTGMSAIGSWAMGVIDKAGIGAAVATSPRPARSGQPDLDEVAM